MDLLILGGSGHVSGALARAAVAAGHKVWAVTRGQRPLPPGVTGLVADRNQAGALEAVMAATDRVWNLVVDCIGFTPAHALHDVVLFRQRAAQLVFISTDFVYDPARRRFPQGEQPAEYVQDDTDASKYGRQKRLSEIALAEADTGAMTWTVFRPCHIYGPTSELGCLPLHGRDAKLIEKLRAGEALKLVGGGHFLQQPILADDLALAILSAAGNALARNRVFNAAGPDIVESREYYRIVAQLLGVGLKVEEVSVTATLVAHPELAPFLCHRIYALGAMRDAGIRVPATPIAEGLGLHTQGLLARLNQARLCDTRFQERK